MIFNRPEENITFFSHLKKRTVVICSLVLSLLALWSVLIQTVLEVPDETVVHTVSEVIAVEFESDLSYVKKFAADSEVEKYKRLFSQFDSVINIDGNRLILSIDRNKDNHRIKTSNTN